MGNLQAHLRQPFLGVGLLALLALGCRREDPRIRELTERAAQTEEASQELRRAWRAQFERLTRAGFRALPPDRSLMLLSPEQRKALEEMVKQERGTSRRALLLEVLAKDLELRALRDRLAKLQAELPTPDTVKANDSHYGLALRFLLRRGCTEAEARAILSRAAISGRIAPGFQIYHFLQDGAYAAWVAQGTAPFSPQDLERMDLETLSAQRDGAVARMDRLRRELLQLGAQKQRIEAEMAELEQERDRLLEGRRRLGQDEARHQAQLNSLHYLVGVREDLERQGIIATPLFDKDHSGPHWRDELFTHSLDLRTGRTLVIQARDLGLARIGAVSLVPGSYLPGVHYRLSLAPDRQTATLELLAPSRFRNDKIVLAVEE